MPNVVFLNKQSLERRADRKHSVRLHIEIRNGEPDISLAGLPSRRTIERMIKAIRKTQTHILLEAVK